MKQQIQIAGLEDLDRAAGEFLKAIGDNTLIAFYAPMGAGKTTFTTAVCKALGVQEDAISSPTFAIVNEYRGGKGQPIYHFDFYRIERPEEGKCRRKPDAELGRLVHYSSQRTGGLVPVTGEGAIQETALSISPSRPSGMTGARKESICRVRASASGMPRERM